jgi:ABC-type glycerol-3-phosphate transport system permease component
VSFVFGDLVRRGVVGLGAILLAVVCGFPLLWMIITSLKPSREILTQEFRLLPTELTLGAYGRLLTQTEFVTLFANSSSSRRSRRW